MFFLDTWCHVLANDDFAIEYSIRVKNKIEVFYSIYRSYVKENITLIEIWTHPHRGDLFNLLEMVEEEKNLKHGDKILIEGIRQKAALQVITSKRTIDPDTREKCEFTLIQLMDESKKVFSNIVPYSDEYSYVNTNNLNVGNVPQTSESLEKGSLDKVLTLNHIIESFFKISVKVCDLKEELDLFLKSNTSNKYERKVANLTFMSKCQEKENMIISLLNIIEDKCVGVTAETPDLHQNIKLCFRTINECLMSTTDTEKIIVAVIPNINSIRNTIRQLTDTSIKSILEEYRKVIL